MWFALVDAAINFYSGISSFITKTYLDIKTRAFENKLIYYAVYDTNTKRYSLVYNYDKPLNVFWYCLFKDWVILPPVSYNDLEKILYADNLVVVCSYVICGEQRNAIYDYTAYNSAWKDMHRKVIFAYSDTNEDLTHEFEKFKNTVFDIYKRFGAQHVFNMLVGYKRKTTDKISYILTMTDHDFIETKLS